jgi:hypothetical protein
MAGRTVDLIASGPCPRDPYDPAAPAWALAAGIASWGDSVRVLHPPGPVAGEAPPGVEPVRVETHFRRPGAAVEGAATASAASRHLRAAAELVIRDPLGIGPLFGGRRRGGAPTLVGVVRGLELAAYDGVATHQHPNGWMGRVETWRDRRTVRRLEQEALAEADHLYYDDPDLVNPLTRDYTLSPSRLTLTPRPVLGGTLPSRERARADLRLPLDVPVVAAPVGSDDPAAPEVEQVLDSFRRVRSLFVGARLVGVGAPVARVEPGVTWVAERDTASFERAFVAADVTLVAPSAPRFDVGAVLAMRAHSAILASPRVRFPVPSEGAVRFGESADPADLAAVLAELLADPAQRRRLVEAGARFAERFEPERVAVTATAERRLVAA